MRLPRCKQHPQALAGWKCQGCRSLLCPDCVALQRVQVTTELEVCLVCSALADPITVHRSEQRGYGARVPGAFLWPISKAGWLTLVSLGLARAVFSYLPGLGWGISACVLAAVCFGLIRSTARGADDDGIDFSDSISDLLVPGIKAMVGAAIVWIPVAVWTWVRWDELTAPTDLLRDPVMWLMFAAGIFYAPMSIVVGAAGHSLFGMLNPVFVVRHALRLGTDYGIAVVTLCVLVVPWLLSLGLGSMLNAVPIPFLPRVLDYVVSSYVSLVAARVLGLLIFTRGDLVGYGLDSDYRVRALAEAPRGVLPEKAVEVPAASEQAARPDRYAPIELEPEAAPQVARPDRYAPIELEPEVEAAPEVPREPARRRVTELDPATLPPLPKRDRDDS